MRHVPVLMRAWLAGAASASAQVSDRLRSRPSRASIACRSKAARTRGCRSQEPLSAYRVWRALRIEGEITTASGESRRSYEGDFISFAGPGATREEFLQKAVIARRTIVNKAGLGFATAVAAVETRKPAV